jgi:hypothetical protein
MVNSTCPGASMPRLLIAAALAATVTLGAALTAPAFADSDPTMDQIYTAAAGGHIDQAQQMITHVLADHPNSAKAHYVQAELYAREGKAALARSELGAAEQLKPGLPFANPRSVEELKVQLGLRTGAIGQPVVGAEHAAPRFPWGTLLILAGVVGILVMVFRRRSPSGQYPVPGPGAGGVPGSYGPSYGPGPMGGGGIGSGIAGGAEAGEPAGNSDMGGADFGVNDPGSGWDDGGFGGGDGGGGDWS